MADRRRRPHSEAESDEESTETGSTQSPRKPRQSECESEGETKEADLEVSDYESANEDNGEEGEEEEEEDDEEEEESEEEEDDDEEEEGEEYEDEDVIIEDYDEVGEERQSGDGEEQPDKSKLDDDEDRKNPAFIPRQGAFYEHDLRLGEESQEGLEEDKRPTGPRKKLWQDEGRWNHDKYADYMQAPKSREELITMYGYDMRLADKPPDAPPRRGGGGGPRRPRDEKPQISDFIPESSRDDSYLVERKNDYNRNRDRNFRGKSEEYRQKDEERGPPPSRSFENQNTGNDNEKHQPPKYDEWNSRYEENQSYRYRSRGDSNKDSGRGYGRNSDSGRGYNRNRDSNRGYERESYQDSNRGYDRPPRRDYDNRGYDRPPRRDYDNRGQRYDNRDNREYRSDRGNYEYQRGGRYNGRGGYRNDPPRREFTYSRGQRGGRSTRPDRGRGAAPRRSFEQERKIPPRFLKKKEQRLQQQMQNNYNTGEYVDHEQMQNYYNDNAMEGYQLVEGDIEGQHVVIQTETYTPGGGQEDVQQQPQEEKAEEKNENVIVQSSTSERKSYSKDRRARTVGKTRVQDSALNAVQEGMVNLQLQESQKSSKAGDTQDRGEQKSKRSSQGQAENYPASSKQDGGRSKRYSSQRQRNPEQASPDTAQFYPQEVPKGFQKQEVAVPFPQPILRPPINYPIPVSTSALPNGPPQRLFRPPPVSMTGPVPIIPPQFINTGVIYGPPQGPGPYPVAPIQGFPSPPPVSTAPPPPIPGVSSPGFPPPPPVSTAPPPPIPGVSSPNQLQEVYRHGTTYYAPELQYPQIKKFSPVKRTKSAIPIVNPEEITGNVYVEGVEGEQEVGQDQFQVDNRDAMLQETIDREFGFEDQTEPPSLYEGSKSVAEPVSDERLFTDGQTPETIEHTDSDLDSLSSRLTTDISNYTIAFSTDQEVIEKDDDQDDERNSPVMEVKNSLPVVESVPIVEQKDSLPVDRISPSIEKGDNCDDERNSPVLEVKNSMPVVESSPVVEQADSLAVDNISPAFEDKNILSVVESSQVVKQDDSLSVDMTSPAIEEKNVESSPVVEEKNSVLVDKSSPVPEDTKDTSQEAADASSSPEISVT